MARKTANDYQKELTDKVSKLEGLRTRIKNRCEEMCEQSPTAEINDVGLSAKDFLDILPSLGTQDTEVYLNVMRRIEKYNTSQHPHVQTTMFPK